MKKRLPLYLLLLCLSGVSSLVASNATPYFSIRSQSVDGARKLAGWADKINLYSPDCENYFVGAALYEYTRSFRPDRLSRCLFGDACLDGCKCPTIKISGSDVQSRGDRDLLADYFYLPTDFQSLVTLRPRIENHIIDFNLYWGLDEWFEGLYVWVQAPAVYTKWNLNYCEEVIDSGSADYAQGYFSSSAVERFRMLDSFSEYISQEKALLINNSPDTPPTGLLQAQPLKYSKWGDCKQRQNETRLSDVHATVGWNIWQCEDYHFGLNFRLAVPTGNRPKGEYFFEPIVGNGHHWEVGGGVSFHDVFWRGCDDDRYVGFYFELALTHLFADKQCRTFDLKNGCNSRYMLATKLEDLGGTIKVGADAATAVDATAQYVGVVSPVANLTTALVNVSYDVQADITVMFSHGWCNWTCDFGYNAWIRSCENLRFDVCDPCIEKPLLNNQNWVLKGDSQVIGYEDGTTPAFPLQLSQSTATIHTGANTVEANKADATFTETQNPGVDNAQFAFETGGNQLVITPSTASSSTTNILASLQPVFLSYEDVDVTGARTKGVSHKVFAHINYNWEEDDCGYAPYLGVGTGVEFGRVSKDRGFCRPECGDESKCKHCALSQWGVWVKGGFTYN